MSPTYTRLWQFLLILIISACVSTNSPISKLSPKEQCRVLVKNKRNYSERKVKRKPSRANKANQNETTISPLFLPEYNNSISLEGSLLLSKPEKIKSPANESSGSANSNPASNNQIFKVQPIVEISTSNSAKQIPESKTEERVEEKAHSSPFVIQVAPYFFLIAGVLSLLSLIIFSERAGNLSKWARDNPWKTRGLLTAIHLGTAFYCMNIGNQMAAEGIYFTDGFLYSSMAICGTSALLYPMRHSMSSLFKFTPFKRYLHDTVLFVGGAALVLSFANTYRPANTFLSFEPEPKLTASIDPGFYIEAMQDADQETPKKKKKTWVKVLLTIIAIAGFAALSFGVAGISCSIACNGSELLAIIFFVFAEGGLVLLLITALKGIFNRPWKRKNKLETEPAT